MTLYKVFYFITLISLTNCRVDEFKEPKNRDSLNQEKDTPKAIFFMNIDLVNADLHLSNLQLVATSRIDSLKPSNKDTTSTRVQKLPPVEAPGPTVNIESQGQSHKVKDFFKNAAQFIFKKSPQDPLAYREKVTESKERVTSFFKSRKVDVRFIDLYDSEQGAINPAKIFENPDIQGFKTRPRNLEKYLKELQSNGFEVLYHYNGLSEPSRNLTTLTHISQKIDNLSRFTDQGEVVILIKSPLHLQARSSGLGNIRSIKFGDIKITGGMRPLHPRNGAFLEKNYGRIHSLDPRNVIARNAVGTSRHSVNLVEDFHPPSINNLAHAFQDAQDSEKKGENLFIHCGFGGGRTGTVLTSFQIFKNFKELPDDQQFSFDTKKKSKPSKLDTGYQSYDSSFKISNFVNKAVSEIRSIEATQVEGGLRISVETPEQFQSLEGFHKILVYAKNMKHKNIKPIEMVADLKENIPPNIIQSLGANQQGIDPALHILNQARDIWAPLL